MAMTVLLRAMSPLHEANSQHEIQGSSGHVLPDGKYI